MRHTRKALTQMLRCKNARFSSCGALSSPSATSYRTRTCGFHTTNTIPEMTTVLRRGLLTTARSCSSASKPWVARGVTNSSPNATRTATAARQLQLQYSLLRTRGLGALNASQLQARNFVSRRTKKSKSEKDEGEGTTEDKETKKGRHDPAGFAKRVTGLLARGNYPRAYALVVNAEKARLDCMVAWNMLLDWKMRNGETQEAFKLFNDVSLLEIGCFAFICIIANGCLWDLDEKKRPETECADVYSHASRLCQKQIWKGSENCLDGLQVYIRA